MQTKIKQSVLCGMGLLGLVGVANAEFDITANIGGTSNYVFRGETQTNDDPALQGGIDYVDKIGIYAGVWASNVENPGTNDTGLETDLYVGYNFELNDDVLFDLGYIAYEYTSTDIPDADELYFGVTFKDFTATYFDGDSAGADYSYVDLKYVVGLKNDFYLNFHYGNLDSNGTDAEDVLFGVSREVSGFDISLNFTSIDRDNGTDDSEVFVTVIKTFDVNF